MRLSGEVYLPACRFVELALIIRESIWKLASDKVLLADSFYNSGILLECLTIPVMRI